MSDIKKPYNAYQEQAYKIAYSTNPQKRVPATHYVIMYGNRVLTNPAYYSICQENLKTLKQMGRDYPDKTKFSIKPYRG